MSIRVTQHLYKTLLPKSYIKCSNSTSLLSTSSYLRYINTSSSNNSNNNSNSSNSYSGHRYNKNEKIVKLGKNNLELFQPKITVVGLGGGGGNAINHMIRNKLEGVDFLVCNTDYQDLQKSLCTKNRILLGPKTTRGHGAGSKPEVGCRAAEESIDDIISNLKSSDLVFLSAGMGGGTGTGSLPVIARELKKYNKDMLVVAVVTRPFKFEGRIKYKHAQDGLEELGKWTDTMVVVSNDKLLQISGPNTTIVDSFMMADEVLFNGVKSISNMINFPGLINLDYSDIKTILSNRKGHSVIGFGEASGEDRALKAAYDAINNPLIESDDIRSCSGVLINFAGGDDVSLKEIGRAMSYLQEIAHPDAIMKVGHYYDNSLNGKLRISVLFVQ